MGREERRAMVNTTGQVEDRGAPLLENLIESA
jgi:hypothetical protein